MTGRHHRTELLMNGASEKSRLRPVKCSLFKCISALSSTRTKNITFRYSMPFSIKKRVLPSCVVIRMVVDYYCILHSQHVTNECLLNVSDPIKQALCSQPAGRTGGSIFNSSYPEKRISSKSIKKIHLCEVVAATWTLCSECPVCKQIKYKNIKIYDNLNDVDAS